MIDTAFCWQHYGNPASAAFKATLVDYHFPAWMAPYWPKYNGQAVTHQFLNPDIIPALEAVFHELIGTGLWRELHTFDGAGNLRYKRGMPETPQNLSIHSWYCAIDFNALLNPLGVPLGSRKGMFSKQFLDVWRRHGWTVGADFSRPDCMHVQYIPGYDKAPAKK